jgi:hypothetical protein
MVRCGEIGLFALCLFNICSSAIAALVFISLATFFNGEVERKFVLAVLKSSLLEELKAAALAKAEGFSNRADLFSPSLTIIADIVYYS